MSLADFLGAHQDDVIAAWAERVRRLPKEDRLLGLVLLNHLPELLDGLASWLASDRKSDAATYEKFTKEHAVQRVRNDVSLPDVIEEYIVLRSVILGLLPTPPATDELRRFNDAIDHAIHEAVFEYTRERERLKAASDARAEAAEALLEQERTTFMNAVVHDLRNPLSNMKLAAQTVATRLEESGDQENARRVRVLEKGTRRLDRLLGDFLDLSLARSNRLVVKVANLDLRELLEEQARIWSVASITHVLKVRACPAEVRADPDRVRQILENLLSNAIKYSPHGGPIQVSSAIENGTARVTVVDQGMGLNEEEQRMIFDPYFRSKTVEHRAGHGLGLFIASQLVRAQGGEMGVKSEPGKGASFWFTLPLTARVDANDSP